MFQYPDLNKRLVYILLEAFLCKVRARVRRTVASISRTQMFHGSKISMAIKKLHEGRLKNRNF